MWNGNIVVISLFIFMFGYYNSIYCEIFFFSERRTTKRDPIPKRVYSMMSEKDLRKWLKNYGLNTAGDKKALISRLQR